MVFSIILAVVEDDVGDCSVAVDVVG